MARSPLTRLLGLAGVLAAWLATSGSAFAATPAFDVLPESTGPVVHVSPSGSDGNRGTEAAPVKTVARGLALAGPGQRVWLHAGRYAERVQAGPKGTAGEPVTLQPAPGERAVIAAGFKLQGAEYVRVTGLLFDGAGSGDWGTSIWSSTRVELSYNEIRNYQGGQNAHGVLIKSGTDVHLIGNRIHDNGTVRPFDHGIYCEWARRPVIANNVIYNQAHGYGVQAFGDCDDALIIFNTIAGNWASGVTLGGNAERGTTDRALVAGNVITDHVVASDAQSGYAVREYQPGAGNVVRDNLVFNNARSPELACPSCEVRDNHRGDPRYVDRGAGDFRLQAGSAALGRGPALGLAADIDGRGRSQAAPDLGAHERGEEEGAEQRMVTVPVSAPARVPAPAPVAAPAPVVAPVGEAAPAPEPAASAGAPSPASPAARVSPAATATAAALNLPRATTARRSSARRRSTSRRGLTKVRNSASATHARRGAARQTSR